MRTAVNRRRDGEVPDIDDDALECLGGTQANSFTASPTTIRPFQGPATLRWSASVPVGCRVDFVIGLNVDDGVVGPYYRSFTVDVDWQWYITTLTLGVTKIVEEFLDERVEGDMKPTVLEEIQGAIDALVALLPDDMKIHTIRLTDDAVVVTACPDGDVIPSRVLAVPAGVRTSAKG